MPTARATIVRAVPFESAIEAETWLDMDEGARAAELSAAVRELNFVLRAHRAAAGDPYTRDVRPDQALALRLGYGEGEQVAEGRFERALELPKTPPKRRRGEALAPQERLAALLGGRDQLLVGEELLLRARLDLDAARPREAALQARIALEALLAELEDKFRAPLLPLREEVGRLANAALEGELEDDDAVRLADAVAVMETAARRSALAGGA